MAGYNFTEDVRRVLRQSREESARLHNEYVGTEHLLLSLTRTQPSTAVDLLQRLNVDPVEIRRAVEGIVKRGRAPVSAEDELPYTSRAKKVLELAMLEARELGHDYVGTEHLLLALLREQKGIGAQVLAHSGLTLDALRNEVLQRPQAARPEATHQQTSPAMTSLVPTPRRRWGVRRALADASFALGTVWAVAGAMKLIFGTAVTFPLLPSFGLSEVAAGRSLIIGAVLFAIGALLRRKRI